MLEITNYKGQSEAIHISQDSNQLCQPEFYFGINFSAQVNPLNLENSFFFMLQHFSSILINKVFVHVCMTYLYLHMYI